MPNLVNSCEGEGTFGVHAAIVPTICSTLYTPSMLFARSGGVLRLSAQALLFWSLSWSPCGLVAQRSHKAGGGAEPPHPAWALSTAPINQIVKKRILSQMTDSFGEDNRFDVRDSTVSFVKLNAAGRLGIWLLPPNESCGATGNCSVWIFDGRTGAELVNDYGWDYGLRKTMHHGVYDFYMRANMSCCTGTLHEYRFDGRFTSWRGQ